nr:hypothetical protein [Deltaproteobacteria bacterium]
GGGHSSPPAPLPAQPAPADPDALFATGKFSAAVAAYAEAIAQEPDPVELTRLRLFWALALRARNGRGSHGVAFDALRAIEYEHGPTLWGRVARLFVDELSRADALRETVVSMGIELRETQAELGVVEADLETSRALAEDQRSTVAGLREERKRMTKQLAQSEAEVDEQAARIVALEQELSALKQIDMQRQP